MPMPTTSQALAAALSPFPVYLAPHYVPIDPADNQIRHPWSRITPGCLIDGSMHSFEDTLLHVIRMAIAFGMPPQEFCPDHETATTVGLPCPGPICQYDHTLLELLGIHDQWWELSNYANAFHLTDQACGQDLNETLVWASGIALDWLNGLGTTDNQATPTGTDGQLTLCDVLDTQCYLVRCHPDYATTHSYLIDDNSLYLFPNDEI